MSSPPEGYEQTQEDQEEDQACRDGQGDKDDEAEGEVVCRMAHKDGSGQSYCDDMCNTHASYKRKSRESSRTDRWHQRYCRSDPHW